MVAAGLAVAVLGAGMTTSPAFADALKDRKATMKSQSKALKVIKGYTKGQGDLKSAVAAAKKIASLAETIPALFPQGSGMGYGTKTRAKPAIWKDNADFKKRVAKAQKATVAGVKAAKAGDAKGVGKAMKAMGCGGCHKLYRGKKPK